MGWGLSDWAGLSRNHLVGRLAKPEAVALLQPEWRSVSAFAQTTPFARTPTPAAPTERVRTQRPPYSLYAFMCLLFFVSLTRERIITLIQAQTDMKSTHSLWTMNPTPLRLRSPFCARSGLCYFSAL